MSESCTAPASSQAGRTVALSKQRTALKNRVHSTLAKPTLAGGAREYALSLDTDSDIFAPKWRPELTKACRALPPETERCMQQHLIALDHIQGQIQELEMRIQQRVEITPNIQLLKTLPGVANTAQRGDRDRARDGQRGSLFFFGSFR